MLPIAQLGLIGLLAFYGSPDSTDADCGHWEDTSSTYADVYETVCEAGIMQGTDADTFYPDRELARAEAAVIANRMAMGIEDYEEEDRSGASYKNDLDLWFTDTPPNEWWNEWILKAMYFAYENDLMSGDWTADGGRTTFRPTENVTTAEFLKIMYEAAKEGGWLSDEDEENFSYSGTAWYSGLILLFDEVGFLENYDLYDTKFIEFKLHYNEDDDSKYHNYRLNLDEYITRQDAAAIAYELIYIGFLR